MLFYTKECMHCMLVSLLAKGAETSHVLGTDINCELKNIQDIQLF